MKIGKNKVVLAQFSMVNSKNELIDGSEMEGDLLYLHGGEMVFDRLEEALEGKKVGDHLQVVLTPEESFGVYDDTLNFEYAKEYFDGIEGLAVGMDVEMETEEGEVFVMTVKEIGDKMVKVDGNHPLADETVTYDITIKDIRDANKQEIEDMWVEEF